MTFQGDVGGIGLADLLQSLARGRDGILTLIGRGGLQSTLGVEEGLIHLLADPSENADLWRDRARAAWVGDPNSRIDSVRMTEIARAHRIEILYRLLDCDSVHFRFTPGPLPRPPEDAMISKAETGFSRPASRRDAVWCAPMPVDALLLEYARLKDEAEGLGAAFFLSDHAVLYVIDPGISEGEFARYATQLDNSSSLLETADRLGWSLRQMCVTTATAISRGVMRLAQPAELLNLAQSELLAGNSERAASRLMAWYETAAPGPLSEQDADFLVHEWNAGRLQLALKLMDGPAARAVLRRVDCVVFNPIASAERWKEFSEFKSPDPISKLRVQICQIRSAAEDTMPPVRDLLAIARGFNERHMSLRAAAFLRIAAARQPEAPGSRIDLGLGLLNAGCIDEGAPWLLDAARTLIDEDRGERVVNPLRTLIELSPSNREARRLLSRARAGAMRRRLTGKHGMLIGAGLVVLLVSGWVHVSSKRATEQKLSLIADKLADPREALGLLDKEFPNDASAPVARLRHSILERRRMDDLAARNGWNTLYRDAQMECARGDPLDGVRKIFKIPAPPQLMDDSEPWPSPSDLLESIGVRGDEMLAELGPVTIDEMAQIHAEQRAAKLFTDLKAELVGHEKEFAVPKLEKRLIELQGKLEARADERATKRAARLKKENQVQQDLLLAAARAHAQAGDHVRSVAAYKQLVELDKTGKLASILAVEIQIEEKRTNAIQRARDLAGAGKHEEAKAALTGALDNGSDYLLPWRLQTVPSGARARLADGTVRVTPFNLETAFGEKIAMTIEKEGCESVALNVDTPADRTVYLTQAPERWWHAKGRVEALPLAVGDDHILCDRNGTIVRMTQGGKIVWQRQISSLGGVARTPAYLPRQKGKLVILTEDGAAWLCDAASGDLEGPLALGSPPVAGPLSCTDGVRARLRDGRTVVWTEALQPEAAASQTDVEQTSDEADPAAGGSALVALRRTASGSLTLKSPWTGWTVEVGEKACMLRAKDQDKPCASLRRDGAWTYVAWEAPHAQLTNGRLWVADGLGLRCYVP
ncbi:MAG TPA: DUF4388 domain-containing protein [Planctomycetota bacterium]|jgi:hypothetical protein|nr:DUF4388 domain-containing protein [Planctomycetota bacterium]